ncbi:hypothetical protein GQ55_3G018400 [Panicum hallii var. hallii]|uniref:Uncharacterized protein n=1 Tax=Panicum hallii var. hallii TaxID=1504633 RepID=A0A2T7E4T5_9POAL|nr:hypothetical protein GQ55_3G018400 [Panicum hallii var. hallii]
MMPQLQSVYTELSSMNTKMHRLTQQYQLKRTNKVIADTNVQKSSTPFIWVGIPEHLLAPMRNQGNTEKCALHACLAATETHYRLEAAIDEPPRKFTIKFCVEDMERQYKALTGNELGSETSDGQMGISRVENALKALKKTGVLGKGKCSKEMVPVAFRIFHHSKNTLARIWTKSVGFWRREELWLDPSVYQETTYLGPKASIQVQS